MHSYNFGGMTILLEPNYNLRRWEVQFNNRLYYWLSEDKPSLSDCLNLIAFNS